MYGRRSINCPNFGKIIGKGEFYFNQIHRNNRDLPAKDELSNNSFYSPNKYFESAVPRRISIFLKNTLSYYIQNN